MTDDISKFWRLRSWWGAESYNFGWHQWADYLNGPVIKLAAGVPIIGYLIIFNDWVSAHISFNILSERQGGILFSQRHKLQMLYFGLIALGVANVLYRIWRPRPMRIAENQIDFVNIGLEKFALGTFFEMHSTIRTEGHRTLSGKYYDSEWDGFFQLARGVGEGTDKVSERANWQEAKSRYEHILRGILTDWWFRQCVERRIRLGTTIILASIGYLLLAAPSVDLFISVLVATVSG